ncbi:MULTISPECIES: NUDIX hydrolase [Rhizobium]|uniref:(Di)nucleoside polyphosphate hydrolase n=1 Tax=Rhizobium favelukesii TaxID=348824 RepID=W6R8K2_9HYPH|nr:MULTISPECIES: NUDIX domain-containing protein [Rhizobium]MCS0459933.1 NUDIX domain-containing protein [Rhizobium favelukesii]UFS81144.1 NUDIX domain-containing protein [Rhizobium sp. T136]CDM57239.1 (Di)nucleoside polyphosphate hydrolase [Rhizobium favelukesii]
MKPNALKVLIYATWRDRLLVFDEPDFPEVALQVPGGTVEAGEDVGAAALREFSEETGILPATRLAPLAVHDYRFSKDGTETCHRRHYFHVSLEGRQPATWLHREMTPFSGGGPILFRFFWLSFDHARTRLGYGMEHGLPLLS